MQKNKNEILYEQKKATEKMEVEGREAKKPLPMKT
jgi:hypothetical protein